MKTIHILNPAAGQGEALKYKDLPNIYVTKGIGDATEFVKNNAGDDVHFCVYGGDGTVSEVVNGIMQSGKSASFSIVPVGTGNDLLRTLDSGNSASVMADVLMVNDKYAINAVNTGFDLDVVIKAQEYKKKKFVSGTLAYVLGVVSVLCKKFGKKIKAEFCDEIGKTHTFEGECLLAVAANGSYYGGGFKCAPVADITDGLIDLLIVKKVSRIKFLSLIMRYMKGKHINPQTKQPIPSFAKYVVFAKCKRVIFSGIDKICTDGEVWDTDRADISLIKNAITLKKEA